LARWTCGDQNPATWSGHQPELWDCKSDALAQLENDVRRGDAELEVASKLVHLTSGLHLYGGDLRAAVGVLSSVAGRLEYLSRSVGQRRRGEGDLRRVVQDAVRAAGNLLRSEAASAWGDLGPGEAPRAKVAAELVSSVQRHGAILASSAAYEEDVEERTREIGKDDLRRRNCLPWKIPFSLYKPPYERSKGKKAGAHARSTGPAPAGPRNANAPPLRGARSQFPARSTSD